MKLLDSINFNTYLAYKPIDNIEPERKIKSENFEWDDNHPKPLSVLCIEKLCEHWMGKLNPDITFLYCFVTFYVNSI